MAKDKTTASTTPGLTPAPLTSSRVPKIGDRVMVHFMATPGPTKRTADGEIAGVDPDGLVSVKYLPRGRTTYAVLERVPYGPTGPFGFVYGE
jgi:hypothetical protein